jgi:sugar lactone lactonase YvrE
MDGKVIKSDWVTGLNAPKGLRSYRDKLYVTDIDEVVQIDIATAKVDWKIKIDEASFLNDIAVSNTGVLYISDMLGSRIYSLPTQGAEAKQLGILRSGEDTESPNGLLFIGQSLVVAGWGAGMRGDFSTEKGGHLFKIGLAGREKTLITPNEVGHLDGLESDRNGGYFVSDWMSGDVMRISGTGKIEVVLRGLKNPADIGYFARKHWLIVPEMGADRVTAFRVQ